MKNLSTKLFTDTDTNYSFTIVGILKSKYKDYLTENNSKKGLDNFSELYLSSLQALFALPSHLESIKKDANITTISNLSLKYFDVDDKQFPLQCKKAKFYYNLDELKDYIVYQKNTDYTHYSFISLSEFKEVYKIIYNKDFDGDFNTEDAQAIFDNTMYTYKIFFYEYSYTSSSFINQSQRIFGVIDDSNLPDSEKLESYLYVYSSENYILNAPISEFRQFYLSLTKDWNFNKTILKNFIYPKPYSEEFYLNNRDFYREGYCDFNSYSYLIEDADYYLQDVKEIFRIFLILVSFVVALGLVGLTYFLIKKFTYKISVLKTLGMSNKQLTGIFGIHILLLSLVSFLISIPITYGLTTYANGVFVNDINPRLVIFSNDHIMFLYIFLSLLAVTVISTAIPLISLYRQSPAQMVKRSNRL